MPLQIGIIATQNEPLIHELLNHLSPLRRERLIEIIPPELMDKEEIAECDIVLMCITAGFIASDATMGLYDFAVNLSESFKYTQTNKLRVIPLLLREVDLTPLKSITSLESIPERRKPVVLWKTNDAGFKSAITSLRRVVENWEQTDA